MKLTIKKSVYNFQPKSIFVNYILTLINILTCEMEVDNYNPSYDRRFQYDRRFEYNNRITFKENKEENNKNV